ncbi:hypothetical protein ABE869_08040 [Enterococcus gilvus]|jgi:hypothetical protein|uniref:hypothetical protein n=1 Tax=Enterococcus gilvus TaxID=160453 RepID=UPI002064BE5A|nr:MAG TPA: hypothetical protein [Caudoviricetes sp.]
MDESLKTALILAIVAGIVNVMVKSFEIRTNYKNEKNRMNLEVLLERNKTLEKNIQEFISGVDSVMKNASGFSSISIRHLDKEISSSEYEKIIINQQEEINNGMEITFQTITSIKLLISKSKYKMKMIEYLEKCRFDIEESVSKVIEYEVYKADRDMMISLDNEMQVLKERTQQNVDKSIELINEYFNEDPF